MCNAFWNFIFHFILWFLFLKNTKFVPRLNTIPFDSFHLLRGSDSSGWAEDIGISWEPWGWAAVWAGSEPEWFTQWWRGVGVCEDCLCLSGNVAWVPSHHPWPPLPTPQRDWPLLPCLRGDYIVSGVRSHTWNHLGAAMSYLILQHFPHLSPQTFGYHCKWCLSQSNHVGVTV